MTTTRLLQPAETNSVGVPYTVGSENGGLVFLFDLGADNHEFEALGASFVIQIATDMDFSNVVRTLHPVSSVPINTYVAYLDSALSPNTTYFWRVGSQPVIPEPPAPVFEPDAFSFFVTTFLTPTIQSIAGSQTIAGNRAEVTWAPITDLQATLVQVNYSETQNDPNPSSQSFAASPNSNWVTGLISGHTYYMSAQAKGNITFNYDDVLSVSNLGLIVDSSDIEVVDSADNMVIASN